VFSRTEPTVVYAAGFVRGIHRSDDGGVTWRRVDQNLLETNFLLSTRLYIDPVDPNTLYVLIAGKYYRTTDGGASWGSFGRALELFRASSLVIDRSDPNRLFVGSLGVFRSTDRGESWVRFSRGLGRAKVVSVAVDPLSSSTLFAGTLGEGFFRSNDGGQTWTDLSVALGSISAGRIEFQPDAPEVMHVGGGMFRSSDRGVSWEETPTCCGPLGGITFDPRHPGRIWIAQDLLSRSDDDGSTYAPLVVPGPPESDNHCGSFDDVAIDAGDSNKIYLHDGDRVWISVDAGATWNPRPNCPYYGVFSKTPGSPGAVLAHPTEAGVVFATSRRGVRRTIDGGASWRATGRSTFGWAHSLAFDPLDPETLYVGTHDDGVFVSTNRGIVWRKVAPGLEGHPIWDLAVDPDNGHTLYAAAIGLGIAKLELPVDESP
jgi:photosystem II stability/assembly factor-like uncharacterized protein